MHPLDLRVAVHYGCHLIKPSHDRKLGSAENPSFFDELVGATGARSIEYEDKTACCGAGGGARSAVQDVALRLTEKKLEHMQKADVDCIVDACPFCHLQFDQGQFELADLQGKEFSIPVNNSARAQIPERVECPYKLRAAFKISWKKPGTN